MRFFSAWRLTYPNLLRSLSLIFGVPYDYTHNHLRDAVDLKRLELKLILFLPSYHLRISDWPYS